MNGAGARLLATARLDTQLQLRNGFFYAVAFFLVCWFVVLTQLPAVVDWGFVLPAVILGNLSMVSFYGSPKVRVGHFARLSRGGCSSRLVQQSIIIPMTADAEWKPKARRMITRTLLCSPSTMPLVTPQRM